MGLLDRLCWLTRAHTLRKKHDGFYASIKSYASSDCKFSNNVRLYGKTQLGNVQVGSHTYFAGTISSNAVIGKYCSIGPNTRIGGLGLHPTNYISTHPIFYSTKKQSGKTFVKIDHFIEYKETIIGNDVWIGVNCVILDGIKVGNGVIIAAGSIVTQDIPDYAIVGGVPARIIKYRYSESEILLLNRLKWWNLSDIELNEMQQDFRDNNITSISKKISD
ncbi:CatB-related O-acetyltransferase [Providencia alcalifaciens]|uniref:CatB-related O-acetyltransferase n=1 Tax=Providencia alcalifaciens TaxID=126385 RepID=UPI001CC34685|nr:CatB-related O-acetyltransferase [Providencia alcalifaciens]CAG9432945.1 2,3,4,5-tetrahydropyridine-2,6-dicarboxylate N-acetyltransferase [Providencia alcalifaciens]